MNVKLISSVILIYMMISCSHMSKDAMSLNNAIKLSDSNSSGTDLLPLIVKRGHLICGVSEGLYGFSYKATDGEWYGLDVDICRGVAVALFGDKDKVTFKSYNAQSRFSALEKGEIDILSRNTTVTLSRDTSMKFDFGPVIFYDGQSFLVRKSSGVLSAEELNGKFICAQKGTSSERGVKEYFDYKKLNLKLKSYVSYNEALQTFLNGECDALTADASGLAAEKSYQKNRKDLHVLSDLISKEPLAPVVRSGNEPLLHIVRWVVNALINAEELGINSKNAKRLSINGDPLTKRFLGTIPGNGKALGLSERWAFNVISSVGNYEELFERNVGSRSRIKLERGLNSLWTQGGVLYAPPMR
ncbi:MAG: amino acid ABC transporter substrate-binding protein [Bacteriovoracaceae bacterium]|nr:amino acid ABC transporter substrate-binding protein [Bacteriovoracaceae bacterium]